MCPGADDTKTLCEVFGKRGMVWPHILILCGTVRHNTRSQTQYLGVVYQASFGYINVTLYKLNFGSILSTLTKRLIDNIYGSLMFIGFTPQCILTHQVFGPYINTPHMRVRWFCIYRHIWI